MPLNAMDLGICSNERQLVAGSKTRVVNVMDLGTCNNESTEKFGSQKEFSFLSGKFMKKLRTIVRTHKKNDNEAEFSGEKLRRATRLLEANGYTMDGKKDHKADTHLLKACQKRRDALNMQSRKVHIMKLLKGKTDLGIGKTSVGAQDRGQCMLQEGCNLSQHMVLEV